MRIWTIPNAVSFARLAGIPVVLWLGFSGAAQWWLLVVFIASGVTDWLDGYLARRLHQYSDLGKVLDPLADRLYIFAALVVLLHQQLLPLAVVAIVFAREIYMAGLLYVMRQSGFAPPSVHYIGKAGTLMLLYCIPFLFLGAAEWSGALISRYVALGWLAWALITYWYAAWLYTIQYVRLRRE